MLLSHPAGILRLTFVILLFHDISLPLANCTWHCYYFLEGGEGGADTSSIRQEEIDRISRKLATLEMKVNFLSKPQISH